MIRESNDVTYTPAGSGGGGLDDTVNAYGDLPSAAASGISGNGSAGDPITNDLITGKSGVGGIVSPDTYGVTVGATNRDVYIDDTGKLGYVASLRDLKTEIAELTDAEWIFDLLPKSFRFKKQKDGKRIDEGDGPVVCGLIAEEVAPVRADICTYEKWTTDAEGQKLDSPIQKLAGVQYSQLIVPLLVELGKLRKNVKGLKEKTDVLTIEIDKLKKEKV